MSVTSKSTHTSQHLVLAHDRWFACGVQLAHLTCAFADAKRLLLRVYEAFMPGGWLKRVSWSACISALGGPCVIGLRPNGQSEAFTAETPCKQQA
jgi:hypothetical protein